MNQRTIAVVKEALALTGMGLFAFGVWQIFPPACYILTGLILTVPFLRSIRGAK